MFLGSYAHNSSKGYGLKTPLRQKLLTQPAIASSSPVLKSNDRFFDELTIKAWCAGKSENSRRAYIRIAEEFLAWIHPRNLKRITIHDVQSFVETKRKATAALRTAALKSLLTHAHKTGYLEANLGAFIRGVKSDSKLTERYLTRDEVTRMIASTSDIRDLAILKLLYNAGLRVSELVAINFRDLEKRDLGEAQFKIRGKGNKERVVIISKSAHDAILSLRNESTKPSSPVFASSYGDSLRLTDRAVRNIVLKAAMRAGISKKVSPHWLRHAHASHALDQGAPIHLVQATLGHSSIATTGRYLHARPSESSGKYLGEWEN